MSRCPGCGEVVSVGEHQCSACGASLPGRGSHLQSLRELCLAVTLILFLVTWALGLLLRPLPQPAWALLLGLALLFGLAAGVLTFEAERRGLTLRHHWLLPVGVVAWILSIMSAVFLFTSP